MADLLNDESFLRWLEDKAPRRQSIKWNRWVARSPERRKLVARAQIVVSMPFKDWGSESDKQQQLERLMNVLNKTGNLKLIKTDDG
ncbi:hypothetical protein [Halalkalibaculum sp. DA3122]|uniref:hypothetical protein n=1 Tax=Halalkalibaculum sp. DA3122 TaxID=3373607 RepID=UPI003754B967